MTELESRIKEFNNLTDDQKIDHVLLMLNELKDGQDDFDYTFSYIDTNRNKISIDLINQVFKSISEAIIYQNKLTIKENKKLSNNIKSKLDFYKEEEAKERENEMKELNNIL